MIVPFSKLFEHLYLESSGGEAQLLRNAFGDCCGSFLPAPIDLRIKSVRQAMHTQSNL
jgi:hypothetical protein